MPVTPVITGKRTKGTTMAKKLLTKDDGEAQYKEARQKAYSEATTELRTIYRPQFNELVKARMEEAGFAWTPKPTAREKALEQVRALAAEYGLPVTITDADLEPEPEDVEEDDEHEDDVA